MKVKRIVAVIMTLVILALCFHISANEFTAEATTGQMVEIGTMTGDSNSYKLPFHSFYPYGYSEQIYTKTEIGNASELTALSLYCVNAQSYINMEIYLADTTKSSFSSKNDVVSLSNATKVYSGSPTFTTRKWYTFNFERVFEHDTSKNLLVIFVNKSTSAYDGLLFAGFSTSSVQSCCGFSNSSLTDAFTKYETPKNDSNLSMKNHMRLYYADQSDVVTITMKANGGTPTSDVTMKALKGVSVNLTANPFTKSGYQFARWNTKADGSGTSYLNGSSITVSANTTLYAQWCKGWEYDFTKNPTSNGWTFIDKDGDHNNWEYNATNEGKYDKGVIQSCSYNGDILTPDNWAITPKLEITSDAKNPAFSVWAKGQTSDYYAEHFAVYAADASKNPNLNTINPTEWTVIIPETVTTANYVKYSGVIPVSFIGKKVYIAIRHFNVSDVYMLNIDDVSLTYDITQNIVEDDKLLGDVNLDNKVQIDDLTMLARHVANIQIITNKKSLTNAEVTGDNNVDIKDLTRLARAIAEIEPFK